MSPLLGVAMVLLCVGSVLAGPTARGFINRLVLPRIRAHIKCDDEEFQS